MQIHTQPYSISNPLIFPTHIYDENKLYVYN